MPNHDTRVLVPSVLQYSASSGSNIVRQHNFALTMAYTLPVTHVASHCIPAYQSRAMQSVWWMSLSPTIIVCTMWPPIFHSVCRRSLQDAVLRELSFGPESLRKLDSRLIFSHVLKILCRKRNEPRPLP
jgi:hypothetical protein